MAWRFRRSLKFGPLKLNLSKSGLGYSLGVRGLRVGTDAKGRSYTAASIPGTGIYNRTYSSTDHIATGEAASSHPTLGAGASTPQAASSGLSLVVVFVAGVLVAIFWMVVFGSPKVVPSTPPTPAPIAQPVAAPAPAPVKKHRAHAAKSHRKPAAQPSGTPDTKPAPDDAPPAE
jgi:cell division septation protein DedD